MRPLAVHRQLLSVLIDLPTSPLPSESELAGIELGHQVAVAADKLRDAGASRAASEELGDAIADLVHGLQLCSRSHSMLCDWSMRSTQLSSPNSAKT